MTASSSSPLPVINGYKPRHRWSAADLLVVRNEFDRTFDRTMESCQRIAQQLGVSPASVHQKARLMGLTRVVARHHEWTREEEDIVRRDYRPEREHIRELAARLGVTKCQLRHRAHYMGLVKRTDYRRDRRPWTQQEDQHLVELSARYSVPTIARKMGGRSETAIIVRLKRLHVSRRIREGWFTKLEVCEILGMGHRWVQRRIDDGCLRASYHNGTRPSQKGMAMWHISARDLRGFIRKHAAELNGRNVDLVQIVELLAGIDGRGRNEYGSQGEE